MLWLRRKRGQSIVVGDGEIEIVVGKIDGDMVLIGVLAPASTSITRSELWLAREAEVCVTTKKELEK